MEQKLKQMLGEQSFALAAMQVQIEQLMKERDDLKKQVSDLTTKDPE